MALHDTHYQHWEGAHQGIWQRRLVIAFSGLRNCLQNKWMRYVITLCWGLSLVEVALLFAVGQLLVADSIVVRWIGNLNPMLQTFARGLTTWLEQHPEISVRVTQSLLLYHFSTSLLTFSLIAMALALPHLITRDLSSNAILVYASRAVSRFDYLAGKAGVLFGVLFLTWLGPVLAAWFLGNLLGPSWHFFWHSRVALGHSLLFVLSGMIFLTVVGLGVSASSAKDRSTIALWIMLWLLCNAFVPIGAHTKPWLKHLSFQYDLSQVSVAVFKLGDELKIAQENLPYFGKVLRDFTHRTHAAWQNPPIEGAFLALGCMAAAAIGILFVRTKPE